MRLHPLAVIGCAAAVLLYGSLTFAAPMALTTAAPLYPAPTDPGPAPVGLVDTKTEFFSAAPLYSGVLTSSVYFDPSNPLAGYTFTYELSNDLVSLDAIHRLTINNFAGYLIEASYLVPTADVAPALVDRSVAGTVGFSFHVAPIGLGEVSPGSSTALLILETNAPVYTETFVSVINGTTTAVPSFAPAPVPEPATFGLLAVGCGVLLLCVRRRQRAV